MITVKLAWLLTALFSAPAPQAHAEASPDAGERFAAEMARCQAARAGDKPDKCSLYGKIQIVEHFPDVTIEVVEHFPDIKVKWVEHFPDDPGKWKNVKHFPDYKVKFVGHGADYKVEFVEHFPGCEP